MSRPGGSERAALLKRWALEAGFHRAGIARLAPSNRADAFDRWIDRGQHAGMTYLERYREKRLDPRHLLEGARSALAVAMHYAPRAEEDLVRHDSGCDPDQPALGRVARYARGDDYHDVMKPLLRKLGDRIESAFPGTRSRSYVDTGPLLEREIGALAGLGAVGKNTNLLHRDGSYFLLGEILLTLDLEPDEPLADMCGQCTRCLDACPTGAFPEPYVLDANRCISYWTIEHRGEVSPSEDEFYEHWLFGCDICQEVCPWNEHLFKRGGLIHDESWTRPTTRRAALTLGELVEIGREDYVETFRKSPMKRAKLDGLRRNAERLLRAEHRRKARNQPDPEDA
ncbi:MAG: tRNA epoxyqueuosine(34) reductase QueG [Acidobacteriota bacterium]